MVVLTALSPSFGLVIAPSASLAAVTEPAASLAAVTARSAMSSVAIWTAASSDDASLAGVLARRV